MCQWAEVMVLTAVWYIGKIREVSFQQEHYQATRLLGGVAWPQDREVTLASVECALRMA